MGRKVSVRVLLNLDLSDDVPVGITPDEVERALVRDLQAGNIRPEFEVEVPYILCSLITDSDAVG